MSETATAAEAPKPEFSIDNLPEHKAFRVNVTIGGRKFDRQFPATTDRNEAKKLTLAWAERKLGRAS